MARGNRWKLSFHRSPSSLLKKQKEPPVEFICPITGTLMADPVIVSSGHTFERNCVLACKSLRFKLVLQDGSTTDFSTVIPNLALKSAILNWCHASLVEPPKPLDFQSAEKLIRTSMASQKSKSKPDETLIANHCARLTESPTEKLNDSETELNRVPSGVSSSSEESVSTCPTTPLPQKTYPSCYSSSSSSSEIEPINPNSVEEDELIAKLKSGQVFEQEEALVSLRKLTRTREETRSQLCTPRLLSALRSLIVSKYSSIQVNSVAALVNLSIENQNKVKILRSGIVPPVIDILRGGFGEAQDHAAGAIFSLALDDQNKTAIGVLGALPPLLHALRSNSDRTRHDSALALYHLSLVHSNRTKLVKLGVVPVLLGMVRSGQMTGRVMMVLCNLAGSVEGRMAMLDAGVVECCVGLLSRNEFDSESNRESCVTALYGLSHGGLRFKGLAKDAGAEEVLTEVEKTAGGRLREKAMRILGVMRAKGEEEEEVDWEELLNSGSDFSRTHCELTPRTVVN